MVQCRKGRDLCMLLIYASFVKNMLEFCLAYVDFEQVLAVEMFGYLLAYIVFCCVFFLYDFPARPVYLGLSPC